MARTDYNATGGDNDDTKFQFDLRQRRALLIGDCIEAALVSFKQQNFSQILKDIDDLFTFSSHAYKGDKDKSNKKEYEENRNKVTTLAIKHPDVWAGRKDNIEAVSKIDDALRSLMEYVLNKIEKSGLFGTIFGDDEEVW